MAQLKIEETIHNQQETDFAAAISKLCENVKTDDCRTLAPTIRTLCDPCGVDMIIGCGGSHVYIHRSSQFIAGNHTSEQNVRWAIITD